jgi:lipoprotein-anchoring transpeptidase ErfK/SrfK
MTRRATHGFTALIGIMAIAALVDGGMTAASAVGPRKPVVKPVQELAMLTNSHRAVSTLQPHPSRVTAIQALRPITGTRTVLPVIAHATTPGGAHRLRVMLPGRPNGTKGWIARHGTVALTTSWHIVVRTRSRQVLVYRYGRRVRAFGAVVGKPSTPTPHGRFFIEESVRMPFGSAGAPFALALSARSNVLQEFEGGPGQIAMHGVANLGGTPGTAISHGCVRLANPNIRWLAARIAPGVRVDITA